MSPIQKIRPKQLAELTGRSIASIRWDLFQRHENGLVEATIKVGRKIFIDLDKYNQWLESYSENLKIQIRK